MAMPDLIQNLTNSFLELTPGTSATPANLKTLLEWINRRSSESMDGWSKKSAEMAVRINKCGSNKQPELYVALDGPERARPLPNGRTWMARDEITYKCFPATEDGLLRAIVFLKKSIHKFRTEGTCDTCEPPTKRLKADGMPKCEDCMMTEAIGF